MSEYKVVEKFYVDANRRILRGEDISIVERYLYADSSVGAEERKVMQTIPDPSWIPSTEADFEAQRKADQAAWEEAVKKLPLKADPDAKPIDDPLKGRTLPKGLTAAQISTYIENLG
jgi:hypothetical protein